MTDEIWIQKDGTPIAVEDMSEGHVRNTLRMIIREGMPHRKNGMWVVDDMDDFLHMD
jgi:hypothetical protein